jgi:hypothetical protein
MNVALLPVAAARASIVLLQPGGPCSSTPLGGDSPSRLNTSAATNTWSRFNTCHSRIYALHLH